MFDATRLSVILFTVIRWGLPVMVILLAISGILRALATDARDPKGPFFDGVSKFRLFTSFVLFAVWLGLFVYNETAYRPKTTLRPDNPALEEKLRAVDSAPTPVPAPKASPTPTWDEKAEKNRRENEEARKAFEDSAPDRK